jgi:type I restriction enzyme R subunit
MRKALPSATFIGFTGTPLEKEDKNTYQTFGKLIDKYTISEAVADGETVAIVYEARRQDLHIITDKLEEEFESYFHNKTDIEKEEIKKKFINKLTLAEADDRIEDIAIDILKHYRDNIYPSGFKAQIVCVSRHACVKYYNSIKRHMKEILGEELEAQIIYSCENNEAPELVAHRTTKFVQDELIKRYKLPIEKDELCFLIVKDMLITGFDAPVEQVMYLDRPLKEHGLLQAIARVNRTYTKDYDEQDENGTIIKKQRTKNYGFVVDYFGITRYLADALSLFDKNDLGEPMKDMNALYQNMLDYKEAVMRMFTGVDRTNIDAIMNVLKPDNKRAEFEFGYKRFGTAIDALMPSHVTQDDLNTLKWLTYIKVGAKARFEPQEAIDISDCGEKAKELVIKHLKSMGVYQWISPVTLFDKDYKEKLDTLKSDEAVASSMEHAIKHTLAVKMKDNPVRFTSLFERLQKLLDETKNNWEARRQELKQFIEQEMEHGEEDEANRLGFKEKRQLAIFETIKIIILKDSMELVEDEAIRQITFDCIDVIKKMKVSGFEHNQTRLSEIETAMFEMLLTKHYSEIGYEKVTQMSSPIIDLAKIHYSGED